MTQRDDEKRDAHLLAALRNAPDRQAAPPPELSAAILAAARAAVRRDEQATRERGSWRARASAWFGRPHAPWTAAFGTLVLGAILGLMWSAIAPTLPPSEPPMADAPAPSRTPSAPSAPVQAAAEPKALGDTLAKAATPAAATQPSKATAAAPASKGKEARTHEPPPQAFGGAAADPRAGSKERAQAEQQRSDELSRRIGADAAGAANAAPAAAAAPAPRAVQESDSASGRLRQERAATAPLLAAKRADLASSLDAQVRAASGEAAWQAAAASWPNGEAQRRWWASVMQATQGRWQLQTGGRALPVPWLTLTAGQRSVAQFWIEDGALWVREDDRVWRAAVGEAQLREWQEAVSRW